MKRFILKAIGKKEIVNYLINQIGFEESSPVRNDIWMDVFRKVPEAKQWMRSMQVKLLKSSIIEREKSDFIKGQIYLMELLQNYDVAPKTIEPKVAVEEKKLIPLPEFLKRWNNEKEIKK